MKKNMIRLLSFVFVIALLCSVAFAAETWGSMSVEADKSEVAIDNQVTLTVYLDDCAELDGGVKNFKATVTVPEGLSVVSAAVDNGFTERTGMEVPACNVKEDNTVVISSVGNAYGGYTGEKIAIATVVCKAETVGTYTVTLAGSLTDSNYATQTPAVSGTVITVLCEEHTYADEVSISCSVCGYTETISMHRLYNPNSGEHFYTGSEEERDVLIAYGWSYEGVAWQAPVEGGLPIYRLYNPNTGDHHYTGDEVERDTLVEAGWNYENVAWNTPIEGIAVHRLYNPNADVGTHHYTTSEEEVAMLKEAGWWYESIAWNGVMLN